MAGIMYLLGWRIPIPGFRSPPESTRIRPSTESGVHFCMVKMPMQVVNTAMFPVRGCSESTQIQPNQTQNSKKPTQSTLPYPGVAGCRRRKLNSEDGGSSCPPPVAPG